MRSCLSFAIVLFWLLTLTLLIPGGSSSALLLLMGLMIVPYAQSGQPEFILFLQLSYPLAVIIVLIASSLVVLMANDKRQTLKMIAKVDAVVIGITFSIIIFTVAKYLIFGQY